MLAEDIKSERLGAGVDCIDNAADIVIFDHWQNRPENFFPRNCHFGVGPPDQRWREIFLIRIAEPAFEAQRAPPRCIVQPRPEAIVRSRIYDPPVIPTTFLTPLP